MGRLVVVSNRVAPVNEGKSATGGLAIAVLAALRRSGGIWFGWSGEIIDQPAEKPDKVVQGKLTYSTIDLSPQDFEEYYNGFSNRALWPLFHYRLDLTQFRRENFQGYRRVNAMMARKLAPDLKPDDLIWIHDYHLIPLAEELRQMGFNQRMGFFLHTPFPAVEVLTALPEHAALMRALCAYDLIGFQTINDLGAFYDYVLREARGEIHEDNLIQAYGRTVRAEVFPISIDTANVERQSELTLEKRQNQRMQQSLQGRSLIVGVDRLDYSKGLPQRFAAFERLLEVYPGNLNNTTFMQIAPPTRTDVDEYMDIRQTLERSAGHINGRFAEFDWVPIRYLNKSVARNTLFGFFRISRVGLVTPLRDGMNLVAKEYVAAQDPEDPGVLVLSRFAGAAREMDSAVIVNPYDVDGTAQGLQMALEMPLDERKARWQTMIEHLREHDIGEWRRRFVNRLKAAPFTSQG